MNLTSRDKEIVRYVLQERDVTLHGELHKRANVLCKEGFLQRKRDHATYNPTRRALYALRHELPRREA